MKLFLKIALFYISFLVILNSCSIRHHSGFEKVEAFETQEKDFIAHHFQKLLFNTQIHAFGKDVSGLLFIKLIDKDNYRFVFLTQLGMKIFDAEINKQEFKIHYLISYLDKKSVRKLLENDLKLLIQTPQLLGKKKYFSHKNNSSLMLREKGSGQFYYYQYQNNRLILKEISGGLFTGTKAKYTYKDGALPQSINIKHSGINLEWDLRPIKRKPNQ